MSLVDELAYGLRQLIQEQGALITFRHVTTLDGANPAPNPPTYIAPVVDGARLVGAATLNVRVDFTQGGVFTGRLIAGDKFTIAGDLTIYTVSADIVSPSATDTLTGLAFAPPLAHDAADGAALAFTFLADVVGIRALVTDFKTHLINGTTIQRDDHKVRFLASDLPGVVPKSGDHCILQSSGEHTAVIDASGMENQGVTYGWALQVRA